MSCFQTFCLAFFALALVTAKKGKDQEFPAQCGQAVDQHKVC